MPRKKDLTGQIFGKLKVISQNFEISKQKKCVMWDCICECGNKKTIRSTDLLSVIQKAVDVFD